MINEVLVVGAGAAGLMAAGRCAAEGRQVLLLEKNEKVGRKIGITGKGRCNVTNAADEKTFMDNLVTNPRFMFSALKQFNNQDTMALLEAHGVTLKVERGERVFPTSDKAFDIIDGLARYARKSGAKIRCSSEVKEIKVLPDGLFQVKCEKETYTSKALILSTGGLSYPTTGSTGDGLKFCDEMGLEIIPMVPGLIPFTVKEEWCRELMGLSLRNVKIRITQGEKAKPIYEDFGEMLFTHFGVSGPVILSAASRCQSYLRKKKLTWEEADLKLHIDLKNALSADELDARMRKDLEKFHAREFRNSFDDLLPRKMIPVFVRLTGVFPGKKAGELSREERLKAVSLLKDFSLTITGTRPIEEAIISMGGVSVKELDPSTMMVKMIPGLFLAGEMIDIDALTGGFNLQLAFSSGQAAGKGASDYILENGGNS